MLARIDKNSVVKDSDYNKIKDAYGKWKEGYYVVIYGGNTGWACNLFVGETLFLANKTKMTGGKYYSAKQIWNAEPGFHKIDKKEVRSGDIVAFYNRKFK